jgi:hypothetical protein
LPRAPGILLHADGTLEPVSNATPKTPASPAARRRLNTLLKMLFVPRSNRSALS